PYEFGSPEVCYYARCVRVDGRYYDLTVHGDGSGLSATPARVPLGTLRSGYERFALMLGSDQGILTVRSETGTGQVPIGEYRLLGWQIEQRDTDGSVWLTQGMRNPTD